MNPGSSMTNGGSGATPMSFTIPDVRETPMQSTSIGKLAEAMAKAQGEITGALKDSTNPFFKSRYADLASCWDACRGQLSKNGLAVLQSMEGMERELRVVTILVHSSGEWVKSWTPVRSKDDTAQGMGSAITYARRYALAAMVGLAQIDDDAEAAQGRNIHAPQADSVKQVDPKRVAAVLTDVQNVLAKDLDEDAQCLELFDLHTELAKDPDLYTASADAMAGTKVLTKQQWKDSVKRGKELANRMVA